MKSGLFRVPTISFEKKKKEILLYTPHNSGTIDFSGFIFRAKPRATGQVLG